MFAQRSRERGQALILIVFAILGLVAITGLAIDGGDAYSDRRHAQTAADTAAMATALTKVRNPSTPNTWDKWSIAQAAGVQIAATNGYSTGGTTTVNVYHCDEAAATCALPTGEDPKNFVQVTIQSTVATYFAPVVGIRQVSNYVQAVAKAVDPVEKPWYDGNALVALMPGCKPLGYPDDPFTVGGGSTTFVLGTSGVFVNSNCNPAYTISNNSYLHADNGVCVVGGASGTGATGSTPPQTGCGTQYDLQTYKLPPLGDASCPDQGTFTGNAGSGYIATPGYFTGTFPPNGSAGHVILTRGIYCLQNGFDVNGNWDLTTDANNNGNFADSNEGVVFYVKNGGVTINGGTVHLSAMEDAQAQAAGLKGYLFYLPPTNSSDVNIAGNGGSALQGTILAPSSPISVAGNSTSDSFNMECQIIGYSVKLTGNGLVNITYNESLNGTTWTNPVLQPYNNK